jgi:hypothetical protein
MIPLGATVLQVAKSFAFNFFANIVKGNAQSTRSKEEAANWLVVAWPGGNHRKDRWSVRPQHVLEISTRSSNPVSSRLALTLPATAEVKRSWAGYMRAEISGKSRNAR